jgi:hypothetical protein
LNGPLTKKDLDATVAAHRAWVDRVDVPAAAKSVNPRDAALLKAIWQTLAPVLIEIERRLDALEAANGAER